ncbi:MAG: sulfotransferase [Candidatus Marinimicrobia bacterium]|nr:sulfotransferase [Candidatus Neomarinimicrobiota bacterium]
MKVFGAGFGRTGTMSLKFALEKLRIGPCYHMREVVSRPSHIKLWYDISRGEHPNWNRLFSGFNSAVDFPVCLFYKQLINIFPEAKFILTLRDFDTWYISTANTIYKVPSILPDWFERVVYPIRMFIVMQVNLIWVGLFKNNFSDREATKLVYYEHMESVKKIIPADKLLIYNVKEGWEPLCEFLDVDVPDIPFPKVNDTAEMLRNFAIIKSFPYVFILFMITISVILFMLVL